MSFCEHRQEKGVIRVPDSTARQDQQTLPPKCLRPPKWIENILTEGLFLWCVLSVTVDPLFFYAPVINEERKCVALDRRLFIGSTCLRTVLDSILLVDIILQCLRHFANASLRGPEYSQDGIRESGQNVSELAEMTGTENPPKLLTLLPFWCRLLSRYLKFRSELWSLAIDVLAILPIPQVLLPIIFSKLRGSESLNKRKVLTAVVLFQYLPRAIRIYLSSVSWRNAFTRDVRVLSKSVIAVKAGFNLFMFIVASHILGGFWYFLSVQRETACWHLACQSHSDKCVPSSFACNHGSFSNYTFLNDSCPIQTPNTTVFDFGIFQGALQSGTVASTDFPRKILYCFWWGLRNLSSFGSNLQTSPHIWENCFAVLTSISGLLLFMYFLGRLQMYMQWEASRKLDEAHQRLKEDKQRLKKAKQLEKLMKRWEKEMKARKSVIIFWIDRQPRLAEIRETIINQVEGMFTEEENLIMSAAEENFFGAKYIISRRKYEGIVDAENPFPYLPIFTRRDIQRRLCLPLLRKVPMTFREAISDRQLQLICDSIKQVYYSEDTYIIREGEPLDRMLFITKGVLWKFATTNNNGVGSTVSSRSGECIEEGCYCGEEILNWGFHGFSQQVLPNLSDLPISAKTLKTHTKVEAFALMANDLKAIVSRSRARPTSAIEAIQEAWRRHRNKVRNCQLRASNT